MNFVFCSLNQNLFEVFKNLLCSPTDSMLHYTRALDFISDLLDSKILCDILIFDAADFLRYKKFIFTFMRDSGSQIPVVFVNEDSEKKGREIKWLFENELNYNKPCLHHLSALFEKINRISELPVFKKAAINKNDGELIQKNPPELKSKFHFSPVNQKLYTFFLKNKSRVVYLEEIETLLGLDLTDEISSRNKAYTYVSRFRHSMEAARSPYRLLRICSGGYKMLIKN